jgi:hypothetical protein
MLTGLKLFFPLQLHGLVAKVPNEKLLRSALFVRLSLLLANAHGKRAHAFDLSRMPAARCVVFSQTSFLFRVASNQLQLSWLLTNQLQLLVLLIVRRVFLCGYFLFPRVQIRRLVSLAIYPGVLHASHAELFFLLA